LRRQLNEKLAPERDVETETRQESPVPTPGPVPVPVSIVELTPSVALPLGMQSELIERHFTIMYGDIGFSYALMATQIPPLMATSNSPT
jgi:ATP-dependent Lon protease